MNSINLNEVFKHYAHCALWTSDDDTGTTLDSNYDLDDIDSDSTSKMMATCAKFITDNKETLEELKETYNVSDDGIGHDIWLTQNGHGAGFWDRGYDSLGEKLTDYCRTMVECNMYIGGDNKVYVEGC